MATGVHHYFRNDSIAAKHRFDTAINQGSRDPRAYYFRALLEIESGNAAIAESDILQGAQLELEGRGTYDVWNASGSSARPPPTAIRMYARPGVTLSAQAAGHRSVPTELRRNGRGATHRPIPTGPN